MSLLGFTHDLRAAIVDLDGTMVDTLGDFDVALNRTLQGLALAEVSRAFIERTVGKGGEHLVRQTLAHVGADAALFDAAWTAYQQHYAEVNGQHSQVFEGVVEGLESWRARGWRLACLTNKPQAPALALLQAKGLAGFFEQCFGGDSFERKKPDPLPLLRTCEALGVAPAQALMVGDSRNDAEAARAAGCPVVLVSYGYNHGEPIQSVGADAVIERLDAL
ncbi:phosphoglycolate phosphatase [Ideonella paludis]|nr:phosphoglycolate phosphatase [Ideonella paludis]